MAKLLGLELKLRQYEQGKFFCDAVVRAARDPRRCTTCSRRPEALPTLAELAEPTAWLRRVGFQPADRSALERVGPRVHRLAVQREQAPLAVHAAQRVRAAVLEAQPRPDHQLLDGARGQHLAGAGGAHHARGDVHGDAGHVVGAQLALAGVQPDPDVELQLPRLLDDAPPQLTARAGPSKVARKPSPRS